MSPQTDLTLQDSDSHGFSWRITLALVLSYVTIASVSVALDPGTLFIGLIALLLLVGVAMLRSGFIIFLLAAAPFEVAIGNGLHYNAIHYASLYACIAMVCLRLYFSGDRFVTPPAAIFQPLMAFSAWVVFRGITAIDTATGLKEIVKYLASAATFMLCYHLVDSHRTFRKALLWQMVAALTFIGVAIGTHLVAPGVRLSVFGSNPNAVGFYAHTWASISVLSYCYCSSRAMRVMALAQFAGSVYVLALTGSRASALALLVFVVVFLVLQNWRRTLAVGVACLFFAAGLVLASSEITYLLDRLYVLSRMSSGMTMRGEFWSSAVNLIRDYPLAGVGGGCIKEVFWQYVRLTDPRIIAYAHGAVKEGVIHNGILNNAAQYGLIGLGLVIWINWATLKHILAARRFFEHGNRLRILTGFCVASIAAVLVHGVFESTIMYGVFIAQPIILVIAAGAFRLIVDRPNEGSG